VAVGLVGNFDALVPEPAGDLGDRDAPSQTGRAVGSVCPNAGA
jgi:hypothetical protein